MPVLGVCGDSFMTATINGDRNDIIDSEGKHFTEILAKKLNYEYFTLARSACSNIAIRFQIEEMINRNVDLVLIGTTTPGRIEFPHPNKKFDKKLGVYNFDYSIKYYPDQSCRESKFQNNIVTETITNIFDNHDPRTKKTVSDGRTTARPYISTEQLVALEYYVNYLFDIDLKKQIDEWIIYSGIKSLEEHNIPFIICVGNQDIYFNQNKPNLIRSDSILYPGRYTGGTRRWHTTDEDQLILADLWFDYIKEHSIIKDIFTKAKNEVV